MSVTRQQLVSVIVDRLKTQLGQHDVIPVASLHDGFRFFKGNKLKKRIGVHFGGGGGIAASGQRGQRTETPGGTQKSWLVNIYVYHLAWNKIDRVTGIDIGDGVLGETDTVEDKINHYAFPTELPQEICDARIIADMDSGSTALQGAKNVYYVAWCGFTMLYKFSQQY